MGSTLPVDALVDVDAGDEDEVVSSRRALKEEPMTVGVEGGVTSGSGSEGAKGQKAEDDDDDGEHTYIRLWLIFAHTLIQKPTTMPTISVKTSSTSICPQ